jgi:hypothetical protein
MIEPCSGRRTASGPAADCELPNFRPGSTPESGTPTWYQALELTIVPALTDAIRTSTHVGFVLGRKGFRQ